eukprot:TRINITY_DN17713_c0_g1_i1.p1 TRINITY_DN17713_c0_g1~~TRINITY_DN17713_c0_g1_i1.p1  ORF type:complete len:111 (+),score=15.16 TRINITY_DN17713_c0_g1_i1:204-536(+)
MIQVEGSRREQSRVKTIEKVEYGGKSHTLEQLGHSRIEFLRSSSPKKTINDLHKFLSPFVASVRGQCDLILGVEVVSIKQLETFHSQSTKKRMFEYQFCLLYTSPSPRDS